MWAARTRVERGVRPIRGVDEPKEAGRRWETARPEKNETEISQAP